MAKPLLHALVYVLAMIRLGVLSPWVALSAWSGRPLSRRVRRSGVGQFRMLRRPSLPRPALDAPLGGDLVGCPRIDDLGVCTPLDVNEDGPDG